MKVQYALALCVVLGSLCSVQAQGDQWAIDKPVDKIPDTPLAGRIFGKEFKLKSATVTKHTLALASTGRRWPDGKLTIFIGKDKLGDELVVTPDTKGMPPHIHMNFAKPTKNFPGTLMFTQEYCMRLVVVSRTDSEIKCKIHVSLPDYKKSYLIGAFTATVK